MSELKVYHCNEWHNEYTEFYLKYEADKVIARNKFKRCRANAKWCHDMWFLLRFDKEAKKSIFFWRWWNIWLELADKFKEDK